MQIDFNKLAQDAIDEMSAAGEIEAQIKEAVKRSVKEAIENAMRSYSDIWKPMKEKILEAIDLNTVKITVPEYAATMQEFINGEISTMLEEFGMDLVKKNLNNMLTSFEKKEWTMQEVVDEMKKIAGRDFSGADNEPTECAYFPGNGKHDSGHFRMDMEHQRDPYSCRYCIFMNTKTGGIHNIRAGNMEDNRCALSGDDFGVFLFKLWATGCTIKLSDYIETDYPERDECVC